MKDPNICGVAYCDGGSYDPLIPGYTHHFTTYGIENERCAEQNLRHKAVSNFYLDAVTS